MSYWTANLRSNYIAAKSNLLIGSGTMIKFFDPNEKENKLLSSNFFTEVVKSQLDTLQGLQVTFLIL